MKNMCPSEEILADYIEGRLERNQRRLIENHLSTCDRCLQTIVVANSMYTDYDSYEFQEVPEYVTQTIIQSFVSQKDKMWNIMVTRARRWWEKIKISLADFGMLFFNDLQLAPVRRGTRVVRARNQSRRRKAFDRLKTDIDIQKTGDNRARIKVQIKRSEGEMDKIRVILLKRKLDISPAIDREIASDILHQNSVLFENIPFDHYNLIFTRDGITLGRYLFQIK
jgi:hypothetical protein